MSVSGTGGGGQACQQTSLLFSCIVVPVSVPHSKSLTLQRGTLVCLLQVLHGKAVRMSAVAGWKAAYVASGTLFALHVLPQQCCCGCCGAASADMI
jgi:hypothetical protein